MTAADMSGQGKFCIPWLTFELPIFSFDSLLFFTLHACFAYSDNVQITSRIYITQKIVLSALLLLFYGRNFYI